jgi:hypothetical protein
MPDKHQREVGLGVKRTKSKANSALVTRRIIYADHQRLRDRPQELKVDVRRGEHIDLDYAAAMVAVRTSVPLKNVKVIQIMGPDD